MAKKKATLDFGRGINYKKMNAEKYNLFLAVSKSPR